MKFLVPSIVALQAAWQVSALPPHAARDVAQKPPKPGKLPALGWNSWNAFGDNINQAQFIAAAQKLVDLGLKDAGYTYVNIDDGWSVKDGRDSNGRLIPDPNRFPDGIRGTADRVHAMGLKLGIYSSAGTKTCAGWPASLGYENIDAQTWAEWGVDYLKYDNCWVPDEWNDECQGCSIDGLGAQPNGTCQGLSGNWCPDGYDYSKSRSAERYRRMRDALLAQSRPILYSICDWGYAGVQEWGADVGQSWRSTGDIQDNWPRILQLFNRNSFYLHHVNFYARSDPDMLEVGSPNLTPTQTRTHFAFWAAMKAPLLIGTDLTRISDDNIALLKNKVLLEFNQDSVIGTPAMPYKWGTNPDWTWDPAFPAEFWSGPFHAPGFPAGSTKTLVLVFNPKSDEQWRDVVWSEVPELKGRGSWGVTDGWTGEYIGCFDYGISALIQGHDTSLLVVDECGASAKSLGESQETQGANYRAIS